MMTDNTPSFPSGSASKRAAIVAAIVVVMTPGVSLGQPSFQIIKQFVESPKQVVPSLIEGDDGGLYAPAQGGGAFGKGAILRFDRHADGTLTFTTLHSFNGADGAGPYIRLTRGTDGQIYGTTPFGGTDDVGTAFRVSSSGDFAVLHQFTMAEGLRASTPLVQGTDGQFYGIADTTLFRLAADGTFARVSELPDTPTSGSADLIPSQDGALYATLMSNIYKITLKGQSSVVAPIPNATSLIEDAESNLYGTAYVAACCAGPRGYVFRVTPTGIATALHVFNGADGVPASIVQAQDGFLYGETAGGTRDTVFRLSRAGDSFSTVHVFAPYEGEGPQGLMQATDGALYGSTSAGGLANRGAIYRMRPDGTFTPLQFFLDPTPLKPMGDLIEDADGFLYGTSCLGGWFNRGSVFKISPAGDLTVLHSFTTLDGSCPTAGLVKAADGNFYGTASVAGLLGSGAIFRLAPDGRFSVLHWFAPADGRPYAGLTLASDGAMYGTASLSASTIFRITTSVRFTTLYSAHDSDSAFDTPFGRLAEGTDGRFYGTTSERVFRLAGTTLTVLQRSPLGPFNGGLFRASDGSMYGAGNSVFRITTAGDLTSFPFSEPALFGNPPIEGVDGNFYGGIFGTGQCFVDCRPGFLYSMTPGGVYTILHSFTGEDGSNPWGRLLQAGDGSFYGTTALGGRGGGGVVFRFTVK